MSLAESSVGVIWPYEVMRCTIRARGGDASKPGVAMHDGLEEHGLNGCDELVLDGHVDVVGLAPCAGRVPDVRGRFW
jgi:hypothetical protein